jgi:hypothetical protein
VYKFVCVRVHPKVLISVEKSVDMFSSVLRVGMSMYVCNITLTRSSSEIVYTYRVFMHVCKHVYTFLPSMFDQQVCYVYTLLVHACSIMLQLTLIIHT